MDPIKELEGELIEVKAVVDIGTSEFYVISGPLYIIRSLMKKPTTAMFSLIQDNIEVLENEFLYMNLGPVIVIE